MILHGKKIIVALSRNWVKAISIHLIRKKFSIFQVIYYWSIKKITPTELIHNIMHGYWRNTFAYICHTVNISRLLWKVWILLLVNISSRLCTILDYFEIPTSSLMNTNLGKPSNFSMPSISKRFRSSSAITIWSFVFFNETVIFFENKTRKIKQVSERSLIDFVLCLFLSLCQKHCDITR